MLNETLSFFRSTLNDYLRSKSSNTLDDIQEDRVVFIDGDKLDPIVFKMEAVSLLLINLEEENTLRSADRFRKTTPDGTSLQIQPEIRLNLLILFVAKFKSYEKALDQISLIIQFFQSHNVLDQHNFPALDNKIERLSVELVTLPFSEQNEIWSALRTSYHPSLIYKVKMLVFTAEDSPPPAEISSKDIILEHIK